MYCTFDRGVSTLLLCPLEDQHSIALKQVTAISVSCTECDGTDEQWYKISSTPTGVMVGLAKFGLGLMKTYS